jgi:HEAT repeat protein
MRKLFSCALLVALLGLAGAANGQDAAKATVQSLLKDLKGSDYDRARIAASDLGNFPQFKAQIAPALLDALNQEWDHCTGDIRQAIGVSLARLAGKDAVFPLLKLLQSGKNVEHDCAECGCCFLGYTPGDVFTARDFDPFCENSLLAVINAQADSSHLKAMADLVSHGKWKPELLITIGKVGIPRYAHFISRYKDDPEVSVRMAVARGLGLIPNEQVAVPVLIQLLSRGNEEFLVRWEASKSLIAVGQRGKVPSLKSRLTNLLKERDKVTLLLAARALARLGEEAGFLKLRELAADNDGKVRSEAVLYLGETADRGAKPILITSLDDENLAVRASAIYALGRIGDASMIPILEKAIQASSAYQDELAKRIKAGVAEGTLQQQHGYGTYDLRETLQEALDAIKSGRKQN